MKMAKLKSTVLWTVVALSTASTAMVPAGAQCASGSAANATQLATQAWPAFTNGDYTSFIPSEGTGEVVGYSGQPAPSGQTGIMAPVNMPNISSVASDGQGNLFALLGSNTLVQFAPGSVLGQLQARNTFTPAINNGISVFYAGGTLWLLTADGLYADAQFGLQNKVAGVVGIGLIQAATFDGQYVWFSTSTGALVQVQGPTLTASGQPVSPSVAQVVHLANGPLGNLAFDGQYIWSYSGSVVFKFDPRQGKPVAAFNAPNQIANISFDGTYLWVGNSVGTQITQIDPLTSKVSSITAPTPGHVVSEGSVLSVIYQTGSAISKVRTCDGAATTVNPLPGRPIQEIFDGTHLVVIYGNGTLSFR